MTINEFKAWLEGYEASFAKGVPNAAQWETIKQKLAKVNTLGKFEATAPFRPSLTPTTLVGYPPDTKAVYCSGHV